MIRVRTTAVYETPDALNKCKLIALVAITLPSPSWVPTEFLAELAAIFLCTNLTNTFMSNREKKEQTREVIVRVCLHCKSLTLSYIAAPLP